MKKIIACFSLYLLLSTNVFADKALLIFGGQNHDVFIGCLNCDKYDDSSIWNKYGSFGSKYEDKSIWNKYETYGSKYSDLSPWNKYSDTPPVIVDSDGGFYGYFTANKYLNKRSTLPLVEFLCTHYEEIQEDTSVWYEKLFY